MTPDIALAGSRSDVAAPAPLASDAPRAKAPWLNALCISLLGYAVFGKGWAYIGVPPIFIGELLLVGGLVSLLGMPRWRGWPLAGPFVSLVLLIGWGCARTVPYFGVYGMDALRDAAIWGYSILALIVFWYIVSNPRHLDLIIRNYGRFARIFLVLMPLAWGLRYGMGEGIPRWPWADVVVVDPKAGDVMVHLSGVLAFWVAGFELSVGLPWVILMAGCAAVVGAYERAGMFAFLGVFFFCGMLRPRQKQLHRLAAIAIVVLAGLAATNLRIEVPTPASASVKEREISFQQFLQNVLSVTGASDLGDLDDTKQWRLEWWGEIVGYTIRGDRFWTGKGFGINLADDDGFQVMRDGSLRSPHNAHLTILARAGVPGLVLWAMVQCTWSGAMLLAYIRAKRDGEPRWTSLFLFLLAYWLAFMINATFDVFLEGPMGGIWFWSLYGVGLAALWIHKHAPETLDPHANIGGS